MATTAAAASAPKDDSAEPPLSAAPDAHHTSGDAVWSPQPEFGADQDPEAAGRDLPLLLKIVGSVVAPTTLLTALMLYFGRLHAFWFFQYFGVNFTALDLTPQDFLIRSADGLFVPLTVIAAAALVTLWGYRILHGRLTIHSRRTVRRVLPVLGTIIGIVLVCVSLAAVVDPVAFEALLAVPGLSLAIGVLLLAYAARRARFPRAPQNQERSSPVVPGPVALAEWAAIFVLVSVGLFWAVGDYAGAVGTGRGHDIETALPALPDVVIYSAESLSLRAPGVGEVACQNPAAAYRFRYDGLKLVLQSGGQYLLLPAGWSAADGTALLIPRRDTLRLEFARAGGGTAAQRTTC